MKKIAILAAVVLVVGLALPVPRANAVTTCTFTTVVTTMTLDASCITDTTIPVPDGFTLDGAGYTITAVNPAAPGHFLGAVVKNGGAAANVTNLTVTASGLANVCDGGDDRLRGILFDGASGSIANNTVININQGASGCQEGNAIEVRNEPFDGTGTSPTSVTISGNTVTNYQKNGITANGNVVVIIANNIVTGADPVSYIAQNGIQLGWHADGTVTENTIDGNSYTGSGWVATGLLLFNVEPQDIKVSKNMYRNNQRNLVLVTDAACPSMYGGFYDTYLLCE